MANIKTAQDIAALREGGKRLARVLRLVSEAVRPGVSTAELNELAERLIRDGDDTPSFLGYTPAGARRPFPAAICISVNEEVVHGIPNENPTTLHDGDIVGLDCGVTHKGLVADAAVTVPVGTIDAETKRLVHCTSEALMAGIKAARGGSHIGDIGHAIEAVAKQHDLGVVRELCGHGVGHVVHEEPAVPNFGTPGAGERLVPGMVLALEPMFTLGTPDVKLLTDGYTFVTADGSQSAHFEHTILITDGAPEILTKE